MHDIKYFFNKNDQTIQGGDVYFAKLINILIYTQFQPQAHDLIK
jgi:hypothetical protein